IEQKVLAARNTVSVDNYYVIEKHQQDGRKKISNENNVIPLMW
ncbi:2065_t:CDS:1, partial [Dentiscutata heterogama]